VSWKGEKRLVTDKKEIDVVESGEEDFARIEPEGVIVGENGKFWAQGRMVGGVAVAGESACVELHVKNHSSKKVRGVPCLFSFTSACFSELRLVDHLDTHAPFSRFTSIGATPTPDL
jgi:hypothetical protein